MGGVKSKQYPLIKIISVEEYNIDSQKDYKELKENIKNNMMVILLPTHFRIIRSYLTKDNRYEIILFKEGVEEGKNPFYYKTIPLKANLYKIQ